MKLCILLICALTAASLSLGAELTTNDLYQAREQGTNSLDAFKRRITSSNALRLGFASSNQAQTAILGEHFRVYQVPRARLVAYTNTQPFNTLLEPEPRVIFPLVVGTQSVSSVIVSLNAGTWATDKSGGPGLIKELTAARSKYAGTNVQRAARAFAVEIPVLSFWFLGYTNSATDKVEFLTTGPLRIGGINKLALEQVDVLLMEELVRMAQRYGGSSN